MSSAARLGQERLDALHERFERHHLRGMWQRGGEAPPEPKAAIWRWADVRPCLGEALEVATIPDVTDQRVVGLTTPDRASANRSISMAFQLLNPGERVDSHRHTPAKLRFIVEGESTYTTSEGEQMVMEPGDLLVQPNWTWHGTVNVGDQPAIWLDMQDRNMVNYLGAFRRDLWAEGGVQPATKPKGYHRRMFGIVRPEMAGSGAGISPPFRYEWSDTLQALEELEAGGEQDPYDGVLLEYTNPLTGGHTVPTISAQIQVLRPGETTRSHRHASLSRYFVVNGEGVTTVDGQDLTWDERDCFLIPPLQWHHHRNRSAAERAVLFCVSDRPTLEALGLYHEEGR